MAIVGEEKMIITNNPRNFDEMAGRAAIATLGELTPKWWI